MKGKQNPLFALASGKLANVVVKKYEDKIVITSVPDMSRRKLSAKQKLSNERMRFATLTAKYIKADPARRQRACEMLKVPPNRLFTAIVREYMLTDGTGGIFENTEQETRDSQTLRELKSTIIAEVPDAEVMLYGERTKGNFQPQANWDLLILSNTDHTSAKKWELQEQLLGITKPQGSQVNILFVQKDKWLNDPDYMALRNKIQDELVPVR